MILADENIDSRIIEALRQKGIEVYSVFENQRGIADETIIKLSRNPTRIILTEDKDFGEWVFAHQIQDISVLFLRYHFKDTQIIIEILLDLLESRSSQLFGCFTTISTQKIRIRPLF